MAKVLAGTIDRNRVTIRSRLIVRLDRDPFPSTGEPLAGTAYTWVGDAVPVFIHDAYPEDYPRARSDPELDAVMTAALRPASSWLDLPNEHDANRIGVVLEYAGRPLLPVPAACEVDLLQPETGEALASTTRAWPATLQPASETSRILDTLSFYRSSAVIDEQWQALLDALRPGSVDHVQLVFRPSRAVALEQPDFEEYWSGTLVIDVPGTLREH